MKEHEVLVPSPHGVRKFRSYTPTVSCREAVLTNVEDLQHVLIATVVDGCKQLMETEDLKMKQEMYKLTDDEILALTLFAFDLG